jgi:hypothetical protein
MRNWLRILAIIVYLTTPSIFLGQYAYYYSTNYDALSYYTKFLMKRFMKCNSTLYKYFQQTDENYLFNHLSNNGKWNDLDLTINNEDETVSIKDIQFPKVSDYLLHLKHFNNNDFSLEPSLKISHNKQNINDISIGILVDKISKHLLKTIESLLNNINDSEKQTSIVVIMISIVS